ncbi:MAG TPA: polymer-forming cytoskeletal protein [Pyrinomonadaceae bacterium]|nr:polymer-forming cytoskeletal protein [Pyrinomonadaceae bacterium]
MLRMGKTNKDQTESEQTTDSQTTQFNTSRSGSSYGSSYQPSQPADTQYRPQETASSSRAVTESESLARDIKEGLLSGFVGNGTTLTGEANFKGMLRVDGHLSGQVKSEGGTLIVGNNGQVDADIEVAVATIHGSVNGDIIASQRLELGRAAKVNGNIQTPSLVIEQGAVFEGSCRMIQQQKAAADRQRDESKSRYSDKSGAADANGGSSSASAVTDTAADTPAYTETSEAAAS